MSKKTKTKAKRTVYRDGHEAAAAGDMVSLTYWLHRAQDIEDRDLFGMIALVYAARSRRQAAVKWLIEHNADINAKDGMSLSYAAESGNATIVQDLLEAGANVHLTPCNMAPALVLAANVEIVHLLIEAGANVNWAKPRLYTTPLQAAAGRNDIKSMKLLLEHGADIERGDTEGMNPLRIAAGVGTRESIELLLDAGAKVNLANDDGITPLLMAAMNSVEAVAVLLDHGADLSHRDKDGDSAWDYTFKMDDWQSTEDIRDFLQQNARRGIIRDKAEVRGA